MSEQVKILIADDEKYNLRLLRLILDSYGFNILEATDGAEALRIAREEMPDLLVLDVMMPELSGTEVCAEIKKDPQTEAIPVILLTAKMTSLDDKLAGLDVGANDFITKPVDPAELEARILVQLRVKNLQDRLVNLERVSSIIGTTRILSYEINKPLADIIARTEELRDIVVKDESFNIAEMIPSVETVVYDAQQISEVVKELQDIADAKAVEYELAQ